MGYCTQCGAALGVGRFCTNCGHPVAEPIRATPPAPPPPAHQPPGAARFPLFADQVDRDDAPASGEPAPTDTPAVPAVAPPPPPGGAAPPSPRGGRRRRGSAVPLVLAACAVAVVLALGLGGVLLLRGDGTSGADPATDPRPPGAGDGPADGASGPSGGSSGDSSGDPTGDPSGDGEATDLTGEATASAPSTADPGVDFDGRTTTYDAGNLLDGRRGTCWRTEGDASGAELTFTLPRTATLTEVGLVNGYAKTAFDGAREFDWYAGNRRVLRVEWSFDDGTTLEQDLRETRRMQTVELDGIETTTVRLRLLEVSDPGSGPAARDYTAVSEVMLDGIVE